MNRYIAAAASALALAACASVSTAEDTTLAEAVPAAMPKPGDDLLSIYKGLHSHPELSFKESASAAFLAAELKRLGFEVTTSVGDEWVKAKALADQGEVREGVGGYGVVGVLRNGEGPTVLIRADSDALPVPERTGLPFASQVVSETWTGVESPVMHACGHDVHMTNWVGAARELSTRKDEWSGTLVMIIQPAEEIGLGAQALLADGLFERYPLPDYNLALHVSAGAPSGTIAYTAGYALANVDSVDITVKGAGGHGAYPHTTIDPTLIGAHIVTALQSLVSRNTDPQTPAVVTVGSFKSGAKHNIIPGEAKLLLTVRSYDDDTRQMLLDGIRRIAEGQAAAFGAPTPEVVIEKDYTPANYNDPELTEAAVAAMREVLGEDKVVEAPAVMGGEDFSQYGRTDEDVPGFIFWVGAVEPSKYEAAKKAKLPLPSLHSPFFAPDAETTIETGVTAMTAAAIALFAE